MSLNYFKPCVLYPGHWWLGIHSRVWSTWWFPRHLRIVSSCEVQWQSLEDVDLWKVSHLGTKGTSREIGGFPNFHHFNRGWKMMRFKMVWVEETWSILLVEVKSSTNLNATLTKTAEVFSLKGLFPKKTTGPFAGRFDVIHHIVSNHQPIWPDFVVVVVQGLAKIMGTTIPERFPILHSSVLWESILGCHPRRQKWKSNVWSWSELYQHKDMMFCMKNYRLLSKVTSNKYSMWIYIPED